MFSLRKYLTSILVNVSFDNLEMVKLSISFTTFFVFIYNFFFKKLKIGIGVYFLAII